jgi:hypothetical protein
MNPKTNRIKLLLEMSDVPNKNGVRNQVSKI